MTLKEITYVIWAPGLPTYKTKKSHSCDVLPQRLNRTKSSVRATVQGAARATDGSNQSHRLSFPLWHPAGRGEAEVNPLMHSRTFARPVQYLRGPPPKAKLLPPGPPLPGGGGRTLLGSSAAPPGSSRNFWPQCQPCSLFVRGPTLSVFPFLCPALLGLRLCSFYPRSSALKPPLLALHVPPKPSPSRVKPSHQLPATIRTEANTFFPGPRRPCTT